MWLLFFPSRLFVANAGDRARLRSQIFLLTNVVRFFALSPCEFYCLSFRRGPQTWGIHSKRIHINIYIICDERRFTTVSFEVDHAGRWGLHSTAGNILSFPFIICNNGSLLTIITRWRIIINNFQSTVLALHVGINKCDSNVTNVVDRNMRKTNVFNYIKNFSFYSFKQKQCSNDWNMYIRAHCKASQQVAICSNVMENQQFLLYILLCTDGNKGRLKCEGKFATALVSFACNCHL